MQFVVEGENTQIGQFTLNFENYVDQSLHTGCFKNMHWIKQLSECVRHYLKLSQQLISCFLPFS